MSGIERRIAEILSARAIDPVQDYDIWRVGAISAWELARTLVSELGLIKEPGWAVTPDEVECTCGTGSTVIWEFHHASCVHSHEPVPATRYVTEWVPEP